MAILAVTRPPEASGRIGQAAMPETIPSTFLVGRAARIPTIPTPGQGEDPPTESTRPVLRVRDRHPLRPEDTITTTITIISTINTIGDTTGQDPLPMEADKT